MTRTFFIEDEHAFAIGVIDRLRADDYHVRWESNGSAGYQAACANTFDLILLDVSLPGRTDLTSAVICGAMAYPHRCFCTLHGAR